ncbi:MAG: hypothetical protein HY682_00025 [Chloroflexi bacterium]|nr:hypothetical protein [Chloroflexota bacterium]
MTSGSPAAPKAQLWTKPRVAAFLANEGRDATTRGAYAPPGTNYGADWKWLPDSAIKSPAGLFLIEFQTRRLGLVPPFQPLPPFEPWQECLNQALDQPRRVGVILLRLGHYAVGVVDNDGVIASKSGARYVHGRHRAGGQSQRRWERNREQWIEKLFDEVCEEWRAILGPHAARMDGLALGGDRLVVGRFLKRCPAAGQFDDRVLPRRLDVQRPGSAALAHAPRNIWSCMAYVFDTPAADELIAI